MNQPQKPLESNICHECGAYIGHIKEFESRCNHCGTKIIS
jgi:DNA-directed RNA polymerase subunit RPC12/RpoP